MVAVCNRSVRASSLNCYLFEALPGDGTETQASLITQQMQLADPCTFRLIIKVRPRKDCGCEGEDAKVWPRV